MPIAIIYFEKRPIEWAVFEVIPRVGESIVFRNKGGDEAIYRVDAVAHQVVAETASSAIHLIVSR